MITHSMERLDEIEQKLLELRDHVKRNPTSAAAVYDIFFNKDAKYFDNFEKGLAKISQIYKVLDGLKESEVKGLMESGEVSAENSGALKSMLIEQIDRQRLILSELKSRSRSLIYLPVAPN